MLNVALITSTISPKPFVMALKVLDPVERLRHYLAAFDFYSKAVAKGVFDRIVYADNSGHNLDAFREIALRHGIEQRVEFLSFSSSRATEANNRLYLELEILEHCFAHSRFLSPPSDVMVWKITGRYIVRNVKAIVKAAQKRRDFDMVINHRNHPYKVVDFYFVGLCRKAFDLLFGSHPEAYQGRRDGEITLRERLDALKAGGLRLIKRMPRVPRLLGVRGYDGASYGRGIHFLKYVFRSTVDRVFPWVWI